MVAVEASAAIEHVLLTQTFRQHMDNYDRYSSFTRSEDWASICRLNGVELDSFGTKRELKVLPKYLEPDEVVFALTSGMMPQSALSNSTDSGLNTWLVALTSDRFLFLDHALLSGSVDTQSIRHDRVQAVSASQGWVLGKISVDLGSRIVTIDNCQKATVAVIADLANKWLKTLSQRQSISAAAPVSVPTGAPDPLERLEKLAKLHSAGSLTDAEFSAAKAKLIDSM